MGFEAIAVTIAMYCLIQFYVQLKEDIADHKPLLKVAAIKLVIFLSFWQSIVISFLTSAGVLKSGPRFATPDIKIGIPSMLLCVEMAAFSIFHLWAFSWLPYRIGSKLNQAESVPGHSPSSADYKGGFLGVKAIMEAFNPWDLFKAVGRSVRWLFVGRKRRMQDPSYQQGSSENGGAIGLANTNAAEPDTAYRPFAKAGHMGDEGDKLLHNAQSNPGAGPPPAYYSNDNPYDKYPNAGDIGVARSDYDEDDAHGPVRYPAPSTQTSGQGPTLAPSRQSFHRPGRSPDPFIASPGDTFREEQPPVPYGPHDAYRGRDQGRYQAGDERRDERAGAAVPYPDQRQNNPHQQNRISMPYALDEMREGRGGSRMR